MHGELNRPTWRLMLGVLLLWLSGVGAAQAAQICQKGVAQQAVDPRWQRLDAQTVRDQQTGLVWQACGWGLSGQACQQDQVQRLTWPQAKELVYRLNKQAWGGASNWRLPTVAELTGLVRPGCLRPSIDLRAFPNTPTLWFWSDGGTAEEGADRAYLDFTTGWPGEDDPQLANAVRLVREDKPAAP